MRKKFVQFAALLLAVCLLQVLPHQAKAVGEDRVVQVGLYYGGSALPGANLENSVGAGYRFGLWSEGAFTQLGYTAETKISMVKTQNVYYTASLPGGGYGYSDQVSSDILVGCYHLLLPGSYSDFESAAEAAQAVGGFPAWISGDYQVRIGAYPSLEAAEAAQLSLGLTDAVPVGTSAYGITAVVTGTARPVFQFDGGQVSPALTVMPGLDGDRAVTHFKGLTYYGGFRYERIGGGNLTVVNLVPLEDYIRGILPYEMSSSWPLEALKAQAVCARSYTMVSLNRHSGYHFDLCNTTHCQVYYGTGSANATTDRAVDETLGEYAWYNGEIAQTYYHACDGGATENSENVWTAQLPYLKGVTDPHEALVEDRIPGYHWTKTYTGAQLQARLNEKNYPCGEIADLRVTKTTAMGNVYSISFTDVNGKTWTVSKENARTVLGVSSMRFTITGGGAYDVTGGSLSSLDGAWVIGGDGVPVQLESEEVYAYSAAGVDSVSASGGGGEGSFVITGTGNGHNLGMSQWGAYSMAQQGYTYRDILTFYFTGVEIHT